MTMGFMFPKNVKFGKITPFENLRLKEPWQSSEPNQVACSFIRCKKNMQYDV